MRILFLSNFYPPARPGGYTQWCYEVAQGLEDRGHTIGVLTSRHEREKITADEPHIYRLLHLEGDLNYYQPLQFFLTWQKHHRANLMLTRQVVEAFSPDIVFIWGMWSLSQAVPVLLEKLLPERVVYFLSDYWPSAPNMHIAYWQEPTRRRVMRLPKRLGAAIARSMLKRAGTTTLAFKNAICVSAAVRDILIAHGVPLHQARVIHGGTDTSRFVNATKREGITERLRLLYAGQFAWHKGVHTALAAMNRLVNEWGNHRVHLTLVGTGHPSYEAYLRRQVEAQDLQSAVSFCPPVTREQMPDVLQQFDVLLFPSIYEEPLARMTQEAMAAGLVVIGTTTGGTKEILINGENGLTFVAEDDCALAKQIACLAKDSALFQQLSHAGRQTVFNYFNLDRMVKEIEQFLQEVWHLPQQCD